MTLILYALPILVRADIASRQIIKAVRLILADASIDKFTNAGRMKTCRINWLSLKFSRHLLRTPISRMCSEHESLIDHETWTAILEPTLCKDSAAVECLARLLFIIKNAIDQGPDGAKQASSTLSAGIEMIYIYTDAHKVARKLYPLSLTGHLKPQDEPLQLINEALKRSVGDGIKKKRR
jgi:hypothetical protein